MDPGRRYLAILLAALAGLAVGCGRRAAPEPDPGQDLVALFDLAVARHETRRIDFGAAAGRAFLERGWSWDQEGETSLVWAIGARATIRFFLATARDLPLSMRVGGLDSPTGEPQRLRVSVNGRRIGRLELAPELAEYRLTLPAAALEPGWNRLELHHAHWARGQRTRKLASRWDWLEIGEPPESATAPTADVAASTLLLPWGSQLEYTLWVPAAGYLEIAQLSAAGEFGLLEVLLERQGEELRPLASLPPGADLRLPLGKGHAGVGRLVLRAIGGDSGSGLALLRPHFQPVATGAAGSPSPRANVLVYLIDALRADRVGPRAGGPSLTPNIDALATDGLRFADAIAQSAWTKPTVTSLFTGLLPPAHGVLLREHALPGRATTLAEALLAAGYRTAAFSTNPWLTPSFGLDQGFLDFVYLNEGRPGSHHAFSNEVNDKVFEWLDRERQRPFFLYVHTIDPHAPHTPPLDDGSLARGEEPEPVPSCQEQRPMTDEARRRLIERYEAEVAFNDRSFGRLVEQLRRRGLYDDSLIVVLSDHGEAFWEHEGWRHENFLYREVLDVPLIVKPPRGAAIDGVADVAQQIDVMPTILDLLQLPLPAGIQGESLVSPGAGARARFAYLECPSGKRMASVLAGPWKLIRTTRPDGSPPRVELYHRQRDPDERDDLAAARPAEAERLLRLLASSEAGGRSFAPGTAEVGDDLQETLRALGYVD